MRTGLPRTSNAALTSDPPPVLRSTLEGEIAWSDEGPRDAPALLCLHGIPGSARDFRYLAPLLSAEFRVIRIELPGFGASPPGRISSIGAWSRVPSAVAAALRLEQYLLVGHSFGGATTLPAALYDAPRVCGLILVASAGARRHRGFAFPPFVFRWIRVGLAVPGAKGFLAKESMAAFRKLGLPEPRNIDDLRRQLALIGSIDFSRQGRLAEQIACPVLAFHAPDDPLVEVSVAEEFCARFPRARLTVFEDGGHHLQKTRAREIAAQLARTIHEIS